MSLDVGDLVGAQTSLLVAEARLREGGMVLVIDAPSREAEGDLLMSAARATERDLAFMIRHTSGIICAPMESRLLDRLELPPMVASNTDPHQTAFSVSVDASGVGTGVSARDRATTLRTLADARTRPVDLRRPGHVFPLRAVEGGVLQRPGHTEAAIDLLRLAGEPLVGVIGEVTNDDGSMPSRTQLLEFAEIHAIPVLEVSDLVQFRRTTASFAELTGRTEIPTAWGLFTASAYRSRFDGEESLALSMGDLDSDSSAPPPLVRVHSECLTGDLFGSLRCDCGDQLTLALQLVAEERRGVVVYLRGHEGRGIGLGRKLRAYCLQDEGRDTVDANLDLGLPVDAREYSVAAQILAELGVRKLRLLTNNAFKAHDLEARGLDVVEVVPLPGTVNPHNLAYLYTKRDRLGHSMILPGPVTGSED